jgi:FHS family L-fucose permease-like MFS transporter
MGPEQTGTRRLNFAQSFNPMGSLIGMFTAQRVILLRIDPALESERNYQDAEKAGSGSFHST